MGAAAQAAALVTGEAPEEVARRWDVRRGQELAAVPADLETLQRHRSMRELLSIVLKRDGHHVLIAESGKAALDILKRERVDVLHTHKFGSNTWGALVAPVARVPVFVAHEHTWSYEGQPLRKLAPDTRYFDVAHTKTADDAVGLAEPWDDAPKQIAGLIDPAQSELSPDAKVDFAIALDKALADNPVLKEMAAKDALRHSNDSTKLNCTDGFESRRGHITDLQQRSVSVRWSWLLFR